MFLTCHKTTILGAALPPVARRDKGQLVRMRIVAVGWPGPICGAGVDRSFLVEEVPAHPPPSSPRAAAIQLWRGSKLPLIYQGHKKRKFGLAQRDFPKYSFIFSRPRSTDRRTALSCTPSASAISQ